jgi:DNA-binding LacI/PurR family transcriptional regulator
MTVKKQTTIRDVAKLAQVSYQTVSRVINNSPDVAEETRRRVQDAMRNLDYHPNQAAQMLTTRRSRTLEAIIVDVVYGGRLADSTKNMARAAKEAGYNLLVSETELERLPQALEDAAARLIEGIILYAPRMRISDEDLLDMAKGIPLVRRDYVPGSKVAWIGFDQVYATRIAVEHLLELGHRQIGAIPPESDLINGYWRHKTWLDTLREYGLEPGPAVEGDYSISSGYVAANQLLDSGRPFTALVVGTDNMAMGALRALHERGLNIPEDVSIVSFDNTELSAYTEPPLTTVEFKFFKQDEMSVKYLIEIINDPDVELHQRILMANLIIRQSTHAIRS